MAKPQIKCTFLDTPLFGPWFAASLWFLSCDWLALCDISLSNWLGSRWHGLKGEGTTLTLSYIKMKWQTIQHQDIRPAAFRQRWPADMVSVFQTHHWGCVWSDMFSSYYDSFHVSLKSVLLWRNFLSVFTLKSSLLTHHLFLFFWFSLLYFYWLFCLQTTC